MTSVIKQLVLIIDAHPLINGRRFRLVVKKLQRGLYATKSPKIINCFNWVRAMDFHALLITLWSKSCILPPTNPRVVQPYPPCSYDGNHSVETVFLHIQM